MNVPDLDGCMTPKKIVNGEKKIVCETPPSGVSPFDESSVVTGTVPVSGDNKIKESSQDFAVGEAETGSTDDEAPGFPSLQSVYKSRTT